MPVVYDIVKLMEKIAPRRLAQDWDNAGLQIGDPGKTVQRIMVSLDPSLPVVKNACDRKIDLLITHHPLIFKAIKTIDVNTPLGKIIEMATRHQLSIFSAHTNLDSAAGGLNDIFSSKIGLTDPIILSPDKPEEYYKLIIYVPVDYCQKILDALFEHDSYSIGDYSCCTFRCQGKGTFKPGSFSKPHIGKPGEISQADEVRIETRIQKKALKKTIEHIRSLHPYETMAYDVYPLVTEEIKTGFGRIGRLQKQVPLASFAQMIKSIFDLQYVKVAGSPDLPVEKVAVCTGSGSSMMKDFLNSDAQVFVTGDLKYHDAQDAQMHGKGLVDIGHFASEKIMIEFISQYLTTRIKEKKYNLSIETCNQEKDPFIYF